jgi:hypothetical protein
MSGRRLERVARQGSNGWLFDLQCAPESNDIRRALVRSCANLLSIKRIHPGKQVAQACDLKGLDDRDARLVGEASLKPPVGRESRHSSASGQATVEQRCTQYPTD